MRLALLGALVLAGCGERAILDVPPETVGIPEPDGCTPSVDPDQLTLTVEAPSADVDVANDCELSFEIATSLDDPDGAFGLDPLTEDRIGRQSSLTITVRRALDTGPNEGQLLVDFVDVNGVEHSRAVELYAP